MDTNERLSSALFVVAGALGVALSVCSCARAPEFRVPGLSFATEEEGREPGSPPPLVIDNGAPLLLDGPTEAERSMSAVRTDAAVENTACFVCHADYDAEPMVARHAVGNVGCADCHGDSYAHRNDENNTTPPDVMYPADTIDEACRQCHAMHDVAPAKVIALWLERGSTRTEFETIVCTDCHGNHRLDHRRVVWDKKTRKLIRAE